MSAGSDRRSTIGQSAQGSRSLCHRLYTSDEPEKFAKIIKPLEEGGWSGRDIPNAHNTPDGGRTIERAAAVTISQVVRKWGA